MGDQFDIRDLANDREFLHAVFCHRIGACSIQLSNTVNPIHITLPMHGRAQFFFRQLQVRPGGELTVNFKALRPGSAGWLLMAGVLVAGFLLFRALVWLAITWPQSTSR